MYGETRGRERQAIQLVGLHDLLRAHQPIAVTDGGHVELFKNLDLTTSYYFL